MPRHPAPSNPTEHAIQSLIRTYQSLNSSQAADISHTPSALEFAQHVSLNRPLVIRGEGERMQCRALHWDEDLLEELVGRETKVEVTGTPDGKADAVIDNIFVEPATIEMTLPELFASFKRPFLTSPSPSPPTSPRVSTSTLSSSLPNPVPEASTSTLTRTSDRPVFYLQSQNNNLASPPLNVLANDLGPPPDFALEVFGESPEVANVWIGSSRSVTSLHKDPYENIYLVVKGSKTFTLLPPTEYYCLHEQTYPAYHYSFSPPSEFHLQPTRSPSSDQLRVPWSPVDPISPNLSLHPRYAHSRPMTIHLSAGDMLYLPSLWFHHVCQGHGAGGGEATIAVNWWFEMKMDGARWSYSRMMRRLTRSLGGEEDDSEAESE